MNCIDCKDFTCQHRSESTGGGSCYYESGEQKEKLLTMAAEASLHYVDWSSFRKEAAKDILCAMIGNKNTVINLPDYRLGEIEVSNAIFLADELIRQLKQE